MAKKTWNDTEMDQLARQLVQRHPALAGARQPHQVTITDLDITSAMEQAIPPQRQDLRPKYHQLRRELVPALARLRQAPPVAALPADAAPAPQLAAPGPSARPVEPAPREKRPHRTGESHIVWTPDEWRFYALALHTLYAELNLVNAPELAGLTLRHLNTAAQMLEPTRQRVFRNVIVPRHRLLEVFANARATRDPLFFPPAAATAAVPDTMRPPETALPAVVPQSRGRNNLHHPVRWSPAEWTLVAARLDHMYPQHKFPERNTVGQLSTADVITAQLALPEKRRRYLHNTPFSHLRQGLLLGFREVRAQKGQAAAAQHEEALQRHTERRAQVAEAVVAPNQWEAVLRPLVGLLAQELAAQLLPQLLTALRGDAAPASAAVALPEPAESKYAFVPAVAAPAVARVQRMSVGVVSGRSTYADELRREFPAIKFTFLDSARLGETDSVKNCDKVIELINFTSHSMSGKLRKLLGDRYVPVNGSVTDMKRVLAGWMAEALVAA